MKIVQLEYFIEVVNQNSFTKAARALHISQPSLTATIKKMEQQLGYALLQRTTKDISITEKGIQFYNHAKQLVHQYHLTLEQMYDLKVSQTPKIKISILESTAHWIATIIKQHQLEHLDQHYQVTEILDLNTLTQHLLDFEIHFGISNDKIKHEAIISIPLYTEDYVVLTPKDAFKGKKSMSIQGLPLIVPIRPYQVRKHIDDYFTHLQAHPNIVMEVERFEVATNFVHQHMGYAVIPRIYYQSFKTSHLDAIPIYPNINRTIYINFAKNRQFTPQMTALLSKTQTYWSLQNNESPI
ncbi:LysR family transcriptional regulator [Staphylococcus hyicus]|uniref:LysR family transcriptional regulator n=1 Tax=Staphylococcus hyicus TaxID=1284 RepID=A0ACD5FPP4_STAHY|nr:LysR family transcriptional regulator [Staphylococcus hyicus]MDP4449206.1 LysR family transcriptional regulator [Staphylococcus hyicus]MDP4462962.1 LysR family transcriptional regulator [Staphylococcus hyicus]